MQHKIWIDAGHGGSDSGAVYGNLIEKSMNLETALETKRQLELCGFIVGMTRTTDVYVDLNERCRLANAGGYEFFLSEHENAGGGDGYEFIHSIYGGQDIAEIFADELSKLGQNRHGLGTYSKAGSHGDYYAVIRETDMKSIIAEPAFIDSSDNQIVDTPSDRNAIATAYAKAICRIFNVPYVIDTPTPTPTTVLYRVIMDGTQLMSLSDYGLAVQTVRQFVDQKRYTKGVVQRSSDGANLFEYTLPVPQPLIDRNVLAIQKAMNRLGFKGSNGQKLTEDGVMGTNTQYAISSFQRVVGLSVDGVAGDNTWSAINDITAKPLISSTYKTHKYAIRYIQYVVGTGVDGNFGGLSEQAVQAYQRAHGLDDDGVVGFATWTKIIG